VKYRRVAALAGLATAMVLAGPLAAAEPAWPTQPVRIIFPASAGSTGDSRTRVLADRLSARLGQRFLVENRPGAGTTIGTMAVLAAKPDGYTLLSTFTPAFPTGPLLYKGATYDPVKSFAPVSMFSSGSPFLVVHPSVPASTLKEFVQLAKQKPGALAIGHGGIGGANHLPAELFRRAAGLDFLFVPYKGETQAMADVIGGQLTGMFAYTALAVPHIQAGKVKALAVASRVRNPSLPDLPTVAESGYPGFEFHGIMLLLAPAGTPRHVIDILNREVQAILKEPEVRASYAASGADPLSGTPEETAALIRRELEVNGGIVREFGLSLDD
jgi:tripartite-type tricarboxylate transporter receptor subunit TctC